MLAIERQNLILQKLQTLKKVVVSDLIREFNVSDQTIRRDLDKLGRSGMAIVTYGGALLNENLFPELPFDVRKTYNVTEKKRIAKLAASYVNDGDTIILDASSTAIFVAQELKNKKELTIATNSLEIILELKNIRGFKIIGSGGDFINDYLAFFGKNAIKTFENYNCAKLIFSCKGIHEKKGITDGNDSISNVKLAMIKAARTRILAADSTKFGVAAFSKVTGLDAADIIVTDKQPAPEWSQIFKSKKIACAVAD